MTVPRFLRAGLCAVAWAILAVGGGTNLVAQTNDAAGPAVELPKFEVTDSRLLPPREAWRYAAIPGFEILANTSERATKRFVRDFLLLQEVIDAIMPGFNRDYDARPTALILCGRSNSFDEFLPPERAADAYSTNSLFFRDNERAVIVVDFALGELRLDNETTQASDPYRGFYLEYFRFLIRRQSTRAAPAWLEEGLVQLFAATDFTRKWINFAQVGDGFGGEKIGDFNRLLNQRALLSFPVLFAEQPKPRDAFWAAQSYAFVHLCLYGLNQRYQKPFLLFLQRISTEPLTEDVFKECFHKSYREMGLELRGYLDFTAHTSVQFTAKKGHELPEPPVVNLGAAADADVGRIKGEALRLGGHDEAAHNALIAPYIRGERDPRLLAALGLDEQAAGRPERARKFLEAAAGSKVERPRAYLELARLRLAEALTKPAAADGKLSASQLTPVFEPLFIARRQPPPMPEVYALIAEAWTHSAVPPARENFEVVLEGVRHFPRNTDLLLQATLAAAGGGYPRDAAALAALGAKVALDPADRDRFNLLVEALGRDAAAPAPPILP